MPRVLGRAGPTPPIVVKIGGSLFDQRVGGDAVAGRAVLATIARARAPVVVVPGGGAFADTVRSGQSRMGLSDAAAHRMAILAMHQMALAFVDLQERPGRFVTASSHSEIAGALSKGQVAVWLPLPMVEQDPDIPEDWSITSDGLAAWLAARLGARHLALVKSIGAVGTATAAELAAAGVVDRAFPRIVAGTGFSWSIAGPGDLDRLAALLDADMQPTA